MLWLGEAITAEDSIRQSAVCSTKRGVNSLRKSLDSLHDERGTGFKRGTLASVIAGVLVEWALNDIEPSSGGVY